MSSQTARFVDELVRTYLHPPLRAREFRRKGRTWNRAVGDVVHVLNVQASAYNEGDQGQFTVNLGVFVPSAHVPLGPDTRPVPAFVTEAHCHVRMRIGEVGEGGALLGWPEGVERWWSFDSATDIDRLGREVAEAVISRGVPFLDKFDCVRLVLDFVSPGRPILRAEKAMLMARIGDWAGARYILLDEDHKEARQPDDWPRLARRAAHLLGMDLEEDK